MGKCKKRTLSRTKDSSFRLQFTRQEAVRTVIKEIGNNPTSIYAKEIISLFGITAEELSESGMTYEILRSLDSVLSWRIS